MPFGAVGTDHDDDAERIIDTPRKMSRVAESPEALTSTAVRLCLRKAWIPLGLRLLLPVLPGCKGRWPFVPGQRLDIFLNTGIRSRKVLHRARTPRSLFRGDYQQ